MFNKQATLTAQQKLDFAQSLVICFDNVQRHEFEPNHTQSAIKILLTELGYEEADAYTASIQAWRYLGNDLERSVMHSEQSQIYATFFSYLATCKMMIENKKLDPRVANEVRKHLHET